MTTSREEVEDLAENEQVFGVLLTLHGAVHVVGWVITWRMFEVLDFHYDDVWPDAGTWPARAAGVLWLTAALALMVVGARLALRQPVSRRQLAAALTLSLVMTLTALPSALPGTVVSAATLVAMGVLAVRRAQFTPR